MRRGVDGLLVPGLLLTLLAVAGVTLLLATGAPVLPRHLPGVPVNARNERRSVHVAPSPEPGNAADPGAAPPGPPGAPTATSPAPSRDGRPAGPTEPSRAGRPRATTTATTPSAPGQPQPSAARPTRSGDATTPATNEPVAPACRAGAATVVPVADTYVDQAEPDRGYGGAGELHVTSRGRERNRRALVRFTLPAIPDGCSLASATLTLTAQQASGRRLLVARAGRGWAESVTWQAAPAPAGASIGATVSAARVSWGVTSLVAAMRTYGNHGFLLRDASEGARGAGEHTVFRARTTGAPPTLTVRWA
ncbi:MAG TPA: DNRLRE domain-containing protein [Frankiaceae bacterium]|nr:DNRLRE domain-containing protein [Frankiaceae bacterium]